MGRHRAPEGETASSTFSSTLFVRVPEPKEFKNWVHLDLDVPHDRFDETLEALIQLGCISDEGLR
jgi:hypothetical protein